MKEVCRPACSARSFERDAPSWQARSTVHAAAAPVPRGLPQAHGGGSAGQLVSARPSMAQVGAKLEERGWGRVLHNATCLGRLL